MSLPRAALLGAAFLVGGAGVAQADSPPPITGSRLALDLPRLGAQPEAGPMLAQRAITRSWGFSEDSVYTTVPVPGWRSEGGAMAMSALLPGAGEIYAGEKSGYLFLLAEAMGWTAFAWMTTTAGDRRDQAHAYAGPPGVAASNWSFDRYEAAGGETDALMQLYSADPNGFYERIRDDRYAGGFGSEEARDVFLGLQNSADKRRRVARFAVIGLCLNHVVSAFDALRAARIHNLPLRRNLELRIRPTLGDPGVRMAFEGSF